MKNGFVKNGLVVVIVLLFVGLAFSPSIFATNLRESDSVEITSQMYGTMDLREDLIKVSKQQFFELENLFDNINRKLDTITTRTQAIKIMHEAIVELNRLGLLPKGISIKQVQRLITRAVLNSLITKFSDRFRMNQESNESENVNCLIIGRTNWTFIRPYPLLLFDFPRISPWLWNNSLLQGLLSFTYLLRLLLPFRASTYAYFGERDRLTEYGNVTDDYFNPAGGWVWTIGSNGIQKWKGEFYGNLRYRYLKSVRPDNNNIYWESWDAVGIEDFTGITLNYLGMTEPTVKNSYLGFARQVSFNYSYPW